MNYEQMASISLDQKIKRFKRTIIEAKRSHNLYASVSGGNDSRVLITLIKNYLPHIYKEMKFVCVSNIEIKENIKWLVDNIPKDQVILTQAKEHYLKSWEKFGIPIISKKISMGLNRYQTTKSDIQKNLRLNGGINPISGKKQHRSISKKYHWMVLEQNKQIFSEACCSRTKETPLRKIGKLLNAKPIIGTRCEESAGRKMDWIKYGCNTWSKKEFQCRPLSLFTSEDMKSICKSYHIITNSSRSGCKGCPMGCKTYFEFISRLNKEVDSAVFKIKILKIMNANGFLDLWKEKSEKKK